MSTPTPSQPLTLLPPLPEDCLVSIIVPSYNQGAYIKQALDSILEQTYQPIEIVVVDGASTDATLDVLHTYDTVSEVKWVSEPDNGVVEAVNKGFAMASGQVLAIQSSDDAYAANTVVDTALKALRADSDVGLLYGDVQKIDAAGRLMNRTTKESRKK